MTWCIDTSDVMKLALGIAVGGFAGGFLYAAAQDGVRWVGNRLAKRKELL